MREVREGEEWEKRRSNKGKWLDHLVGKKKKSVIERAWGKKNNVTWCFSRKGGYRGRKLDD